MVNGETNEKRGSLNSISKVRLLTNWDYSILESSLLTSQKLFQALVMLIMFTCIVMAKQYKIVDISFNGKSIESIYQIDVKNKLSQVSYVVRTKSKLLFCNNNFDVIDERPIDNSTSIINSKKNNYFLLVNEVKSPEKFSKGYESWTLIDKDNIAYGYKEKNIHWDSMDIIKTIVSDYNGVIYQLDVYPAKLVIYNSNIELTNTVLLFENSERYISRRGGFDISEDGKHLAININKSRLIYPSKQGRAPIRKVNEKRITDSYNEGKSGEPTLMLLDNNGKILFSKQINNHASGKVNIVKNGKYILTSSKTFDIKNDIRQLNTDIFDGNGKALKRLEFLYSDYSYISEEQILLTNNYKNKSYLISINAKNNNNQWKTTFNKKIVSLNSGDNKKIQVLTGDLSDAIYNGKIFILDNDGKIIYQEMIGKTLKKPRRQLSNSEIIMMPTSDNKILIQK